MLAKLVEERGPNPYLFILFTIFLAIMCTYQWVTAMEPFSRERWRPAAEVREEFPDVFDSEKGTFDPLVNVGYDTDQQLFIVREITCEGEKWCVFTPVSHGKWKICHVWWMSFSTFCVTLPICLLLIIV